MINKISKCIVVFAVGVTLSLASMAFMNNFMAMPQQMMTMGSQLMTPQQSQCQCSCPTPK
jgi:hypothetical protein